MTAIEAESAICATEKLPEKLLILNNRRVSAVALALLFDYFMVFLHEIIDCCDY